MHRDSVMVWIWHVRNNYMIEDSISSGENFKYLPDDSILHAAEEINWMGIAYKFSVNRL